MRTLNIRLLLAATVACLAGNAAALGSGDAPIPDSYAAAAELVRLRDGRALNFRCTGTGARVVLFEAGGNADSTTWYRVRPLLEDKARVCAYDRAGYGFSDEGAGPRDLNADVSDLHELIRAAGISLPLVLVGHSLGSNIVRRYAQDFPQEVAAMVLVDPPEQGADDAMPDDWKLEHEALLNRRDSLLAACEKAAQEGHLDPPAASAPPCLRSPPPWMGERVAAAVRHNKAKPAYWRTLSSELKANGPIFSSPVSVTENHGAIPLVLLSADEPYGSIQIDVRRVLEEARRQTHARILATSTKSKEVKVAGTSHDIQLERPDAVASAVAEVMVIANDALPPRSAGR